MIFIRTEKISRWENGNLFSIHIFWNMHILCSIRILGKYPHFM